VLELNNLGSTFLALSWGQKPSKTLPSFGKFSSHEIWNLSRKKSFSGILSSKNFSFLQNGLELGTNGNSDLG
jgi:hypothetical protein